MSFPDRPHGRLAAGCPHAWITAPNAIMRSEGGSPADAEIEEALARLITAFAEHGLVGRRQDPAVSLQ